MLWTEAACSKQMIAAKRRSEILAATIYLSAALFMLLYLRLYFYWIRDMWADNLQEIVPLLGAAMLLVSSIRVFMVRRFADVIALAGAILAWPYFRLAAFPRYTFSPWLAFNLPGESSEIRSAFLVSTLVILTTSLMVAATAYSVLRLTPRTWSSGGLPLRDRAWPASVLTFLFTVVWYFSAVTPYQIPIFDIHQNLPYISMVHVEKHGLQLHETSLAIYRDGQFYLAQNERRLFQYSFRRTLATGVLTEDCFQLFHDLANSPPELNGSDVSSYVPPKTWNADRWFVFIQGKAGRKPIKKDVSVVPEQLLGLFQNAQKLPQERTRLETARDACLGFCYDPTY